MSANFTNDDDLIADINITPFVDIILVILIIFMITATTVAQQAIRLNLPDAASGESQSTSVGLSLTSKGELLLNGKATTPEALKTHLRDLQKSTDEIVCLIAAEKDVSHGHVVWLIDLVKSEGIAKFAININKTDVVAPAPFEVHRPPEP